MSSSQKLNLGQLAMQAQVPITSIWKVLLGQGATIDSNEFTRIKTILEKQDSIALTTETRTTSLVNIGVVIASGGVNHLDFTGVALEGLIHEVDPHQYMLVLHFFLRDDLPKLDDFIRHIDGMIVIGGNFDEPVTLCETLQRPYVLVETGQRTAGERGALILVDNFAATQTLVQHLVGLGHQKIAMILSDLEHSSVQERLAGYQAALQQAHLPQKPEWVMEGGWLEQSGYQGTKELLALPEPPTAIVAISDIVALGAVRAIRELGLTVGRDVSVTGFDDVPIASAPFLELTTMRQPLRQMGHMAMELLAKLLRGEKLDTPQVRLSPELIVRQSTGQPAAR